MTIIVRPTDLPDTHPTHVSQLWLGVGDSNLPHPIDIAKATGRLDAATNSPDTQMAVASQDTYGVGELTLPQSNPRVTAMRIPAAATNFPDAQLLSESQLLTGVGVEEGADTAQDSIDSQVDHGGLGPILADPTLALAADIVDDLEKVKIANQNRLRTLTDQTQNGHGLTLDHPDVKRLANLVTALSDAEHQATLNLARVMRHHPLGQWVKNSKGVGEKQAARLLASIRDPYWNDLHGRPRKLRELYRFCGMDVVGTSAQSASDNQTPLGAGVAPTKQRGERITWSPDARMRLWLIASKCVMVGHGGPYRAAYDQARTKYANATHTTECRRCGPKGHPAQPGSPLSAAHQHARAIRITAKTILRDLWHESQRIHNEKENTCPGSR